MATIIVIDDDPSTTALLKMLLELEGYGVVTAGSLASAQEQAPADAAALIVDCYLADNENGLEFVQAVRQGQTTFRADIPAILVSGDQRLEEAAQTLGSSRFMLKPYSPNELTAQIRKMLGTPAGQG